MSLLSVSLTLVSPRPKIYIFTSLVDSFACMFCIWLCCSSSFLVFYCKYLTVCLLTCFPSQSSASSPQSAQLRHSPHPNKSSWIAMTNCFCSSRRNKLQSRPLVSCSGTFPSHPESSCSFLKLLILMHISIFHCDFSQKLNIFL